MDHDGAGPRFLPIGQACFLTPRFAPNQQTLVYMSYAGKRQRIYVYNIGSGKQRLVADLPNMTFAPRFSGDGRYVIFSMDIGGNTDIYRVGVERGGMVRLTTSPGIDTGGSYSHDGST